jgi:hypothetical protein
MDTPEPLAAAPHAQAGADPDPDPDVVAPAAIDLLPVSDTWKGKFRLISRAGGPGLPRFDALAGGERLRVGFNLLALLLGPLYYLAKGMWRQAIAMSALMLLAMTLVEAVLGLVGLAKLNPLVGWTCMAIFSVRANVDYYRLAAQGRKAWL